MTFPYSALCLILTQGLATYAWIPQTGDAARLASAQLFPQREAPWTVALGGSNPFGETERNIVYGQLSHQHSFGGTRLALSAQRMDTLYQSVTWGLEAQARYRHFFAWGRHEQQFHLLAGTSSFWTGSSRGALGTHLGSAFSVATGIRKENHCLLPEIGIEWKIGNTAQTDFYLTKSSLASNWEFALGQRFAVSKSAFLEFGWGYPSRRIALGLRWQTASWMLEAAQSYADQLPATNSAACMWISRRQ